MSTGIAAAMNASGNFSVNVFLTNIDGESSKNVSVTGKFWVNSETPRIFTVGFSTEFSDNEVLTSHYVETWLQQITGARLVTRWEF